MKNLRILVVESSIAMRSGIKALLEPLNVEIVEASNGLDGLDRLSATHFDLIVTGGINGFSYQQKSGFFV